MRRLLLDTQVVVWTLEDSERLGNGLRHLIMDPQNQVWVSTAAVWELAIKATKGHIDLPDRLLESIAQTGFQVLDIKPEHALGVLVLPPIHNDPFDRLMVAQARFERMELVTSDAKVWQYDIDIIQA